MSQADAMGRRLVQRPAPQPIFSEIDRRHCKNQYIVKRHRDRGRDLVASANPSHQDREECLKWINWDESKENPDRRSESNGMRSVRHRDQGHVVIDQPAFLSFQECRQARPIATLSS